MWNGMCTIEMIENLKIENSTKMWVCAISPYERRYVLDSKDAWFQACNYATAEICTRHAQSNVGVAIAKAP